MDVTNFPDDLVQTQAAWNATYQALAAPRPRDTTALRRRLLPAPSATTSPSWTTTYAATSRTPISPSSG
ncbi:hypothetical protein ABTZ58_33430 [Streptomyces sp. NPDC094143]|uniref:hypothetical protein n=1 Tax=Streptomyces sp. NPDC094143 TaxID=3155310 RepID=UPI00332326C6